MLKNLRTLIFKPIADVSFMIGGNCPTGVLGQVGGFIELCNQINSEPKNLVSDLLLPVGSTFKSFYKQTKNRNETGFILSLGTRLTGLSNVSDASVVVTQHRTAA